MPDKDVYIFDLDGTLAESKMALSDEMAGLLSKLLQRKKVAVISGGDFPQFKIQVISRLQQKEELLRNLYIFPTSGTRMYVYEGSWKEIYDDELTPEEKEKIISVMNKVLDANAALKPEKLYGEQIEDRKSEITLSFLGQQAPVELKKAWDPDFTKRRFLLSEIEPLLPEFSVKTGGSTSIDVVKKGEDKAYGIEKLSQYLNIPIERMCYIGDALYEGGNDAIVKKTGIESVQVKDEKETAQLLKSLEQFL